MPSWTGSSCSLTSLSNQKLWGWTASRGVFRLSNNIANFVCLIRALFFRDKGDHNIVCIEFLDDVSLRVKGFHCHIWLQIVHTKARKLWTHCQCIFHWCSYCKGGSRMNPAFPGSRDSFGRCFPVWEIHAGWSKEEIPVSSFIQIVSLTTHGIVATFPYPTPALSAWIPPQVDLSAAPAYNCRLSFQWRLTITRDWTNDWVAFFFSSSFSSS